MRMNRIIAICCAALLATACVEPLQSFFGPVANKPEEGTPVTLEFSLPPMTKGTMAQNPDITTLHVAVFNQAGVLKQFEEASLIKPAGEVLSGVHDNNPTYRVQINMSATKRILHFIADSPVKTFDELVALAGTSGEDAILNALKTTGGQAAYWQRVELDKIDAYTYDGTSYAGSAESLNGNPATYTSQGQTIKVYKGDYIKRDGTKVLDGTGYFQSDYVAGKVANIPLVRNFAEIKVTDNPSSNFHPVKFALVNVPSAGHVAPFDAKNRVFATAYIDSVLRANSEVLVHSRVAETGYLGSLADTINTNMPTKFYNVANGETAGEAAYMYERPLPNTQQPSTCILVAGTYSEADAVKGDDGYTWFKIEIANPSGQYFPIYRGVSYEVKIGKIDGSNGYATAMDAFNDYPLGDISDMTSTATLESINDGKGTTLWVEYIDYVATQEEEKTLYYTMYYQRDENTAPVYLLDSVKLEVSHPYYPDKSRNAILDENISGEDGTFTDTPDPNKQWRKATVHLADVGQSTKYSTLTVSGMTRQTEGNRMLSRKVSYEVMATRQFLSLEASPLWDEDKDRQTELSIQLPADLGFSMFPLELMIEARAQNFSSVGHYPVEYGPSLFTDVTTDRFYYLVTIDYDNYRQRVEENGSATYRVSFATTRNGNTTGTASNATTFAVRDKVKSGRTQPYFETKECDVIINDNTFTFSKQTESVEGSVRRAFFHTRTKDAVSTWTLSCDNNNVHIDQPTGTGDQLITVTFPERETGATDTLTYTITGSMPGAPRTPQLVITHKPKVTLKERKVTINVNSQSFSGQYVYNGIYRNSVYMKLDGGYSRYGNYVALDRTKTCKLLVSAADLSRIVVTWESYDHRSTSTTVDNIYGGTTTTGYPNDASSGSTYTTTWEGNSDAVYLQFGGVTAGNNYRITKLEITYLYDERDNQN